MEIVWRDLDEQSDFTSHLKGKISAYTRGDTIPVHSKRQTLRLLGRKKLSNHKRGIILIIIFLDSILDLLNRCTPIAILAELKGHK